MGQSQSAKDQALFDAELIQAAKEGKTTKCQECIAKGGNIDYNEFGRTPLMWAAYWGHLDTVKYLQSLGADLGAVDKYRGWTPLMMAVLNGHTDMVQYLVSQGAKVDAKDNDGKTALDLADNAEIESILTAAMEGQPTVPTAGGVAMDDMQLAIMASMSPPLPRRAPGADHPRVL
ncbi:MAG: hypothetical protein COB65_14315, partial [Thalassobium sp.]